MESYHDQTRPRGMLRGLFWGLLIMAAIVLLAGCHGRGTRNRWSPHSQNPGSATELEEEWLEKSEWILDHVDATDEQETRIVAKVRALVPEAWQLQISREALRLELASVLAAESVDAAKIERIRQEALAHLDEGSKALSIGITEIAKVLTHEQRLQLIEHWRNH